MFGMKDYRAHKLIWLLAIPIRLLKWIIFWVCAILAFEATLLDDRHRSEELGSSEAAGDIIEIRSVD
jgi:hypothetical protein